VTAGILVTRSQPGADETAARLRRRGLIPVVEPLFAIRFLSPDLPEFDAVAFTSANGVRAFERLSARRDAPVWCVGARTAEAARTAGFGDVVSADGDVADLQDRLMRELPAGMRLLHIGNAEVRGDLAGGLSRAGSTAVFVAAYEAAAVGTPGPSLAAHLSGDASLDAILLHSPRAGAILAGFAAGAKLHARFRVAAISQAAAESLTKVVERIEIAQAPNEDALLAALDRLLAEG
jgi:uroporphyrinogen-III synthase